MSVQTCQPIILIYKKANFGLLIGNDHLIVLSFVLSLHIPDIKDVQILKEQILERKGGGAVEWVWINILGKGSKFDDLQVGRRVI